MDTWLRFYLKRVWEHGGLLGNVRKSNMRNFPQHYGVASCCREYWAFQVNNAPLMDGPLDKMDSTQHEYNSFCERGR